MKNAFIFLGQELLVFFLSMALAIGWLYLVFLMFSFNDAIAIKIGAAAALAVPSISFVKSVGYAVVHVENSGPFYDSMAIVAVVSILPGYKIYDMYAKYCESCVETSVVLLVCFTAIVLPWAAFQICSEVLVRRMIRA